MRSLYFRILMASVAAAGVSVAVLAGIYFGISRPAVFRKVHAVEDVLANDAADLFARRGAPALKAYFEEIETAQPGMLRYLVDAHGRDVITGEDRSALLVAGAGNGQPRDSEGRNILVHRTSDGRYQMLIAAPPPLGIGDLGPYIALIFGAIAFLSWWLAVGIASPMREMVSLVNQFGQGQLNVRTQAERRDEIGDLGRAFNAMADRIETLVTAERRLLQDVSHELRSPLTRLSMAIELSRTASDREASANRLQREADRLSHLVDDLLETTRQEGEGVTMQGVVDVPGVLWSVVSDCEVEAEAHGCRLAVESVSAWQTTGNCEVLRRAIENVLRNAIRYAPRGTLVDVSCETRGADVLLAVRDFGPGVPEDALSQLGSPFYRVDPSRDSSTGGMGLGLAMARRALHLHHGTLAVENAYPGLRVTMTLPGIRPGA
ncbi:MAG: ATP-binding protein [Vicinamibacterales bacterium]